MEKIIKGLIIIALVVAVFTITTKEVKEYKEISRIKNNIEKMIKNNGSMETIKEGRKNIAIIEGDKIIIKQDVKNSNYSFTLNKNHENIVNSVLMYMTGYNAFNKNIENVDINF